MRIALFGEDGRYAFVESYLRGKGHEAWRCDVAAGCAGVDCALLHRSVSDADAHAAADLICPSGVVLCQSGRRELGGVRCAALDDDEIYIEANARLTAEAALFGAMGVQDRALYGERCLVYGYGRIGRALANTLRALCADVVVAVRAGASAARAAADDMPRCGLDEAANRLPYVRYIWNTVPAVVLDNARLEQVHREARLYDLASAPYGFSIDRARELGLMAVRLPGLPGKYCPRTAGQLLGRAVERALRGVEGGNV